MGITFGFPTLVTTLTAVACSQIENVNAAILDIRQQYITVHHGLEDEQVRTTANCDLQAKLNACIRHHQDTMA
jgi:hypothetical protein